MTRSALAGLVAVALAALSCGHEFEPPDPAVRVERASASYSPALFDSVAWASGDTRLAEGNAVYAERCRRCHGAVGHGDTDYARQRELAVPSLVGAEWPYANMDSLRYRIYVGHVSGMPVYGDGDLSPRQIDATAAYILLTLRPDVLEQN